MLISPTDLNRWPIHPQPLERESLTSWLTRQAEANLSTPRQFLSSYLGEGRWDRTDLDLLGKNELRILSFLGRVQEGEQRLRRMTLTPWKNSILQTRADQKSWVSALYTTRYCPVCLTNDKISYLRLLWRLYFVPICPEHNVVIQQGCWKNDCTPSQPMVGFSPRGTCNTCGSHFSYAPIIRPRNCKLLTKFVSSISDMLDYNQFIETIAWPYNSNEFFATLLFVVRYLNQYQRRQACWEELLQAHGLAIDPPFDWRTNSAVACIFLESAMRMLKNWPTNMTQFIMQNQPTFNRFCAEYGAHIPSSIKNVMKQSVRVSRHSESIEKYFKESCAKSISCEEKVAHAVEYLLKSNTCPFAKRVSRLIGISQIRLKQDLVLLRIVQEGTEQFSKKQEEDIRNAVRILRSRNIPVTVRALATYLGRSHRYIRKSRLSVFNECLCE